MNFLLPFKEYFFVALSVAILIFFLLIEHKINNLKDELTLRDLEIEKYKTTIAYLGSSIDACKSTLTKQNEAVELGKVDIKAKEDALQKIKKQPVEVRYKVIYKDIPKIEIKSNECDDIKSMLDSIKESGL